MIISKTNLHFFKRNVFDKAANHCSWSLLWMKKKCGEIDNYLLESEIAWQNNSKKSQSVSN
jgi:hypothetical protein